MAPEASDPQYLALGERQRENLGYDLGRLRGTMFEARELQILSANVLKHQERLQMGRP